jgi:multidrug efflux system membrane fusion protein
MKRKRVRPTADRLSGKRHELSFWLGCAAVAWTVSVAMGCSSGGGAGGAAREAAPVDVAEVVQRDVPVQVHAIGNVEAYATVSVKSLVDGQLAEIRFQEGQEVHEGDRLFVIDPRPFQAVLRQAEANLAKNRAEAKNAHVQAERYARLLAPGFISRDQHDQVRTQAESLEAAVKADLAAVETAKLRLQYCYIHSPITGRIGKFMVNVGNVVKERETTLAVINRVRPVYVSFAVPEERLAEIRNSAAGHQLAVHAFVGTDADHPAVGELSFIDNAVDSKTGTVSLKGLFPNEDEMLWPGQFVSVALTLRTQPKALLVPATAIQTGQDGQYVFVVGKDQTVQVRPVVPGRSANEDVVIEKGLESGERVVTRGQIRLAQGSKVEVKGGVDLAGQAVAAGK